MANDHLSSDFSPPADVRRILIGGIGALGNTLLAGPMVQALRQQFPQAEIRFAFKARRGGEETLRYMTSAGRSYLFTFTLGKWRGVREVFAALCWRPDVIIVPFLTGGKAMQCLARLLPGSTVLYHSGGPVAYRNRNRCEIAASPARHEVDLYLDFVAALAGREVARAHPGPWFTPHAADHARARSLWNRHGLRRQARVLAINPFSSPGMAWKRWDNDYWEALLALLDEAAVTVVVLASHGEAPMLDAWPALRHRIRFHEALGVNAALMSRCQLALSCDTGFGHLAAALGVPSMVLFGPTDERRARPWGAAHRVVDAAAACRPCYGLGRPDVASLCSHRSCMRDIAPGAVFDIVLEMLKLRPPVIPLRRAASGEQHHE